MHQNVTHCWSWYDIFVRTTRDLKEHGVTHIWQLAEFFHELYVHHLYPSWIIHHVRIRSRCQGKTGGWDFGKIRGKYWNRPGAVLPTLLSTSRSNSTKVGRSIYLSIYICYSVLLLLEQRRKMTSCHSSWLCAFLGLLLLMMGVISSHLPQVQTRPTGFWCHYLARKNVGNRIEGLEKDMVRKHDLMNFSIKSVERQYHIALLLK